MVNSILDLFSSTLVLIVIISYIIGSIPFGLILSYIAGYGDIRRIGSGNIGATNVLRTGNKSLAVLTLSLDLLKSFSILLIIKYTLSNTLNDQLLVTLYTSVALFSVIGHMYSPFLKFKGGKGIATSAGILLFISYPSAILTLIIWLLVAISTKKSSLGALVSSIFSLIFMWSIQQMSKAEIINNSFKISNLELYLFILIIILIWIKHIPNIIRLLNKTET